MSKLKIKQINSEGAVAGAVLTTDGQGNNTWTKVATSGAEMTVGLPDDGDLNDPRYVGGKAPAVSLTTTTKVATAIDSLNEILGLLLPDAPPAFGGASLTVAGTAYPLADGYTDNTGAGPAAGALVNRVTTATVSSNSIVGRGDGMGGDLALYLNTLPVNNEKVTFNESTGNGKTSGTLNVTNNNWTNPPGFYQTFDAVVNAQPVSVGYNNLQIRHSISGNSTVAGFVRDNLTAVPVAAGINVVESSPGTLTYSSGVPHYNNGASLSVSANLSNLAGQTYLSSNIITLMSTGNLGNAVNFGPGQAGLPAILMADTLSFNMSNQPFVIGNNQHTSGQVQVRGSNPAGTGTPVSGGPIVLVKAGTVQSTQIDEMNIPVVNLGSSPNSNNAKRFSMSTGDTPAGAEAAWTSNNTIANHEAAVVGGKLVHSVTNYSIGYLPAGPDYSGHDANQYVTFAFERSARSTFKIVVTGSYSGCWVKLPGITDTTIATNGWWNMFQSYNGSGVPGDRVSNGGNGSNGCALGGVMLGTSGTYTATFGTQSSTNSTGNRILVRFKLAAGQSITALSFTN